MLAHYKLENDYKFREKRNNHVQVRGKVALCL